MKLLNNRKKIVFTGLFHIFLYYSVLMTILVCLFTFFSNSIRALFLYQHKEQLLGLYDYLPHSFWIGTRLDLQVAAYILLPSFLLGLALSFSKKESSFVRDLYQFLAILALYLGFLIVLGDYYFYQMFNANFNGALFGFIGQPGAVLASIWQDFPIIYIFLMIGIGFIATWKLLSTAQNSLIDPPKVPSYIQVLYILGFIIALSLLVRGSFTTRPLNYWQANFSSNSIINAATNNGVLAFFEAVRTRGAALHPEPLATKVGVEAYNNYFGTHLQENEFSLKKVFTHTPRNAFLEKNPPNVVFVQMESVGRHLLFFDDPQKNDLLGNLRPYTKKDLFFTHFLSGFNYTELSLANLVLSSYVPLESLLHTTPFESAIVTPYKKAGYKTVFLTSGSLGWQYSGAALRKQGFDSTIGDFDLMRYYPEAESKNWGVADRYAFDYAAILLKEAHKQHQPIFIYINTVTNHEPFRHPANYKGGALEVPMEFAKQMHISKEGFLQMSDTYQYTNSMLGDFIHNIEESELKNTTIIAASGDHNQHIFADHYRDYKQFALRNSVYLLLHIPKNYLHRSQINVKQLASHKDIFPTLFNLSLSNAEYANLGNNLLAPHPTTPIGFALNDSSILLPTGFIHTYDQSILYPWENQDHVYLKMGRALTLEEKLMLNKVNAYKNLVRWAIVWQQLHHQNIPFRSTS